MEHYLGVAREKEIPVEQIGAAQAIAMAVAAGKVNAQAREVRRRMRSAEKGR